jgi:murein L,D-transpeptidase YafK
VTRTAPPRSPVPGFALLALLGLAFSGPAAIAQTTAETSLAPDRILVLKSERKLLLLAGDTVIRSMDIALGLMPEGPKHREGDYRTPEGRYVIEEKKSDSDFFLALRISYPNAHDVAQAREQGVDPGGQIMIHGLPNEPRRAEAMYYGSDWTDGCIAVSNSDMIDLWRLIAVATPIEIRP